MNSLYFIPVVIGWSIPFFWIKELTNYYSNYEMLIVTHLCYHLLIFPAIIYLLLVKPNYINNFLEKSRNLPTKIIITTLLIAVFGIISQLFYFKLLKFYDVSFLIPIFRGVSAILILIIGYTFYKETLNLTKIIGIITILFGINILTYS
jgi:multidrug transporter EmrE-like cation transporter